MERTIPEESALCLTRTQLDAVERLVDLEPIGAYPERGAARLAELVGASSYRLEHAGRWLQSNPGPRGEVFSVELMVGDEREGMLHLGGPLTDEQQRAARWGARLLAKTLRYASRLEEHVTVHTHEDVRAMLRRAALAPREQDVVGRLLSGASTRQIAQGTGLTTSTVNTYIKRIFAKLGVHSRVELVATVTGTRGAVPGALEV